MITLTSVLAALVVLTSWDAADADDHAQTVPLASDDRDDSNR